MLLLLHGLIGDTVMILGQEASSRPPKKATQAAANAKEKRLGPSWDKNCRVL